MDKIADLLDILARRSASSPSSRGLETKVVKEQFGDKRRSKIVTNGRKCRSKT